MKHRWWFLILLLLFFLSRLPFLLAHPDWGPIFYEHCFFLSVPGLHDSLQQQFPGYPISIASVDVEQYRAQLHGGSWWIGTLTNAVIGWIGSRGLLALKLVSLFHALIAFVLYFVVLGHVWRDRPARIIFPVLAAWIVPPIHLLWSTFQMLGHYYDTWLFHSLFLLPLVLLLQNRLPIWGMALLGIGCGLSVDYTFSNLNYVAWFMLLYLLLTPRTLKRLAGLGAFVGGVAAACLPFFLSGRLTDISSPEGNSMGIIAFSMRKLVSWFDPSHLYRTFFVGDGWSHRGLLSITFRGVDVENQRELYFSYLVAGVVTVGVCYLLFQGGALLCGRARHMDLGERLVGAHGLLLVGKVVSSIAYENPFPGGHMSGYKAIFYPSLMLGLGLILARIFTCSGWLRWPARSLVVAFCLMLVVGWSSAATWNNRPLLRPTLELCEDEKAHYLGNLYQLPDEAAPKHQWVERRCLHAFPENELFCRFLAMEIGLKHDDPGRCKQLPEPLPEVCAAAWGKHHYLEINNQVMANRNKRGAEPAGQCAEFSGKLYASCISGGFQGKQMHASGPLICLNSLNILCSDSIQSETWRRRACLEQTAWLCKGIGPLPAPDNDRISSISGTFDGYKRCKEWPRALQGVCHRVFKARAARKGEPVCEEVYLQRFAKTIPSKNRLLYEQCMHPTGDLAGGVSIYRYCAIGVARITEGLDCHWDGRAWPSTSAIQAKDVREKIR